MGAGERGGEGDRGALALPRSSCLLSPKLKARPSRVRSPRPEPGPRAQPRASHSSIRCRGQATDHLPGAAPRPSSTLACLAPTPAQAPTVLHPEAQPHTGFYGNGSSCCCQPRGPQERRDPAPRRALRPAQGGAAGRRGLCSSPCGPRGPREPGASTAPQGLPGGSRSLGLSWVPGLGCRVQGGECPSQGRPGSPQPGHGATSGPRRNSPKSREQHPPPRTAPRAPSVSTCSPRLCPGLRPVSLTCRVSRPQEQGPSSADPRVSPVATALARHRPWAPMPGSRHSPAATGATGAAGGGRGLWLNSHHGDRPPQEGPWEAAWGGGE